MDPFIEVQQDAQNQLQNLQQFLSKLATITADSKSDFINNITELNETINDLEDSIKQIESNPSFFNISADEIKKRYDIVKSLRANYDGLHKQWDTKLINDSTPFKRYDDNSNVDRGATLGDEEANLAYQYQQQEILRDQDTHLDNVYNSMQTINAQARAMGSELEDQAYIIDELDGDLDRVGNKVQGGLKRIEYVIRKNSEKGADCCIMLLIIALIVLLVMLVIA